MFDTKYEAAKSSERFWMHSESRVASTASLLLGKRTTAEIIGIKIAAKNNANRLGGAVVGFEDDTTE